MHKLQIIIIYQFFVTRIFIKFRSPAFMHQLKTDAEKQDEQSKYSTVASQNAHTHIKQTPKFKTLLSIESYFKNRLDRQYSGSSYNTFSIIDKNDPDRLYFTKIFGMIFGDRKDRFKKMDKSALNLQQKVERAVACLLGLAVGDALGSCTQFTAFDKDRMDLVKYDFIDIEQNKKIYQREGKVNIWTDDCSMALSLADSLLLNNLKLNPKHSRFMYHIWLHHGLNNGGRPYSIGLGGNISISTREFQDEQQDYTEQGEKFNNGNGSLMRLAPIPVNFYQNQEEAMKAAENQSRTTHNGDEAKQCCRLMTLILVRLINRKNFEWKPVIEKACADFKTTSKSVQCIACSMQEPHQLYQEQIKQYKKFKNFNKKLTDRNWNWKDPNYTYSQSRADAMPGYVGSYCMDALAMALHTVWFGKSFHEIVLKNANMGGDCDTVGAIAGQFAGAIYGIDSGMLHLYSQMEDTLSGRFQVFLKGYKMATHKPVPVQ